MKTISEKEYGKILYDSTVGVNDIEAKDIIKRFVKLLSRKRMLSKSKRIEDEYIKFYNEAHGIKEVTVTLQNKMTPQAKELLIQSLKDWLCAKEILLNEKVDQRVIAGVKIATDEMVYDGTISRKLAELTNKLTY